MKSSAGKESSRYTVSIPDTPAERMKCAIQIPGFPDYSVTPDGDVYSAHRRGFLSIDYSSHRYARVTLWRGGVATHH